MVRTQLLCFLQHQESRIKSVPSRELLQYSIACSTFLTYWDGIFF